MTGAAPEAAPPSQPSPSEGEGEKAAKRQLAFSAIWLSLWLALAGFIVHSLWNAWPHIGSMLHLPLFVASMGVVFRTFDVLMLATGRPVRGPRRWIARVASVVIGALAGGQVARSMENHAMVEFERAVAPLVAQIQKRMPKPCPPPAYEKDAGLRAYLAVVRPSGTLPLTIHHDDKRLVLAAPAGSADIDGSTLVYESEKGAWRRFHNDDKRQQEAQDASVKSLQACPLEPK